MSSRIVSTVAGLLLATALGGCQATPEPLPAVKPSAKATKLAKNEPKGFNPRPTTPEEKEFDFNIRDSLDPEAGPELQNIYWAVKTYAGVKIKGDEVLVALKNWRKAPRDVLFGSSSKPLLRGLAMWFGNMAGDPQGQPRYTWTLVDHVSGAPLTR
jgi:hypothetical protein